MAPGAALAVVQGEIAFGRCVVLENPRDPEALLESLPHLGPQAVAAGDAQGMRGLDLLAGRIDEIAA